MPQLKTEQRGESLWEQLYWQTVYLCTAWLTCSLKPSLPQTAQTLPGTILKPTAYLNYVWKQLWAQINVSQIHHLIFLLDFTGSKSMLKWRAWLCGRDSEASPRNYSAFVRAAAPRVLLPWSQKVCPWGNEGRKMGGTCLHCLPACPWGPLCLWAASPQLWSASSLVPV